MTTHQLATLLDSLKTGMGAFIKADTGKAFDEASSAFRELPDQPLKKLADLIRKPDGGGSKGKAAGVSTADVIARIKAVRDGTATSDGLYEQLDKLKNPELKAVLAEFGQKPTTKVADNLSRVKGLLTHSANGSHPSAAAPAADEKLVAEGVRLFERLRDSRGLSITDVRAAFEPMRSYPKPVVEEISRRLQFTPSGSATEIVNRLLSNLEVIKMAQYRSESILTGT